MVGEVNLLEVVGQTHFDAGWSVVDWRAMSNIDWDQLAAGDPLSHVRFDIDGCLVFRPDSSVLNLPSLFQPNRSDVDSYVKNTMMLVRLVLLLALMSLLISKLPPLPLQPSLLVLLLFYPLPPP